MGEFKGDVSSRNREEIVKFNNDDKILSHLSLIFKALSDPTRLKIIHALSKQDLCVSDISELLNMTQSSISHQLAILRNLQLIKATREGRKSIYSLDDEHVLTLFSQGFEHASHRG